MDSNRIGKNIAALRRRDKVTQQQLAQALSISTQAVSKWERGTCLPDTQTMPAIAKYFRVSIDFLYFGKADETMHDTNTVNRDKNHHENLTIYYCFRAEELETLTDEEFVRLREKVQWYGGDCTGLNAVFYDFYEGIGGRDLQGNGDYSDSRLFKRKSMVDDLSRFRTFVIYERLFLLIRRLGVKNIFDIDCDAELQAFIAAYDPTLHYTGVDPRIFHEYRDDFHTEPAHVNTLFQRATQSDRIRFIQGKYPCTLEIPENNIALYAAHILHNIEDKRGRTILEGFNRDFERVILRLVSRAPTELQQMSAKEAADSDLPAWYNPYEEQLAAVKKIMPEFTFCSIGDNLVFGTKIHGDREKLAARYTIAGDSLMTKILDRTWHDEIMDFPCGI